MLYVTKAFSPSSLSVASTCSTHKVWAQVHGAAALAVQARPRPTPTLITSLLPSPACTDTGGTMGRRGGLSLMSMRVTVSESGALAALPFFSLATSYSKEASSDLQSASELICH